MLAGMEIKDKKNKSDTIIALLSAFLNDFAILLTFVFERIEIWILL